MKVSISSLLVFSLVSQFLAAEDAGLALDNPAMSSQLETTAITGHLHDGTPSPPSPPMPEPELNILKTLTKPIVRIEPAPLPDMQPVQKTVTLTKHIIVEPDYPEVPPPLPPREITDPAVIARMAIMRAKYRKTEMVYVSATVYDRRRTLVKWWPNGHHEEAMSAWSDVDFNLLSGFAEFTLQGRKFSLLMGLGNENSTTRRRSVSKTGRTYTTPEIPMIPADGPGFVVIKGDATRPGALDVLTSLHELYRIEGTRLQDAYAGREQARIEAEARHRANPPQPKDQTTWISEPRRLDTPSDKNTSR